MNQKLFQQLSLVAVLLWCAISYAQETDKNTDTVQIAPFILSVESLKNVQANSAPLLLQATPDCKGCALPLSGENYGFFPYWWPLENKVAMSNFSLFSRMAYFALPVSDNGSISHTSLWNDTQSLNQFVITLNRYNVKPDIMLHFEQWQNWGQGHEDENKEYLIQGLAWMHLNKIVELNNKLSGSGLAGITLYFPFDSDFYDIANIVTYAEELHSAINIGYYKGDHSKFTLNLMLDVNLNKIENLFYSKLKCEDLCNDESDNKYFDLFTRKLGLFQKLRPLLLTTGKEQTVSNILVRLSEPTTRSKKLLRLIIENQYHGEERVQALRKVIPILELNSITKDVEKNSEADHDIAYLMDNFGGIGIWPGIINPSDETSQQSLDYLSESIISANHQKYFHFIELEQLGFIGSLMNRADFTDIINICGVVCPDRIIFRFGFIILLVLTVTMMVARYCNFRVYKALAHIHWLIPAFQLITIILFVLLLGCDPIWQKRSNWILLIALLPLLFFQLYRAFFSGFESRGGKS